MKIPAVQLTVVLTLSIAAGALASSCIGGGSSSSSNDSGNLVLPDSSGVDTDMESDSELDAEPADTDSPDTAEPDTAEPDTAEPDTAEPDTAEPDVDGPTPPQVVAVTPADGSTVGVSDVEVTITFDRSIRVDPMAGFPLSAVATHVDTGTETELSIAGARPNGVESIEFERTGSWPVGENEIALMNFASGEGVIMEPYAWSFTVSGCGDGVCGADESNCNCSDDCGTCDGCCRFDGGTTFSCLPGTANDACGQGGASCGVCEGGDQCAPDGGGCI